MDALLLTGIDYANTGYRFMQSLKSLGLNVEMYKRYRHLFEYPAQAVIEKDRKTLRKKAEQSKVVHFVHSQFVDTGAVLKSKSVVAQHGGSRYRNEHKELNAFFNPLVQATIIQTPDLLGLGAKNESYIVSPVDTDKLPPVFQRCDSKVLHIGHFPSDSVIKGTATILSVLDRLKDMGLGNRFHYVGLTQDAPVTWEENLERVRHCDILIETCNPILNGHNFGEWGNAALEGASLGKIVVTNCQSQAVYESVYGPIGLQIANDEAKLLDALIRLLNLSDGEVQVLREETRTWVERNHGLKATGKRLWRRVYRSLLGTKA